MDLLLTGDECCRRTDAALCHLPRLSHVMDDMRCEADDLETCYNDARILLQTCRENNITLGEKKFTAEVRRYDAMTRQLDPIPINSPVKIQNHMTKLWDLLGHIIQVGQDCEIYKYMYRGVGVEW